MDNFKALPKLNEKLEEMVSSGEARLATVVASYGNEVEVTVTGGARARFPSTHYDPPVGSSGALIATRGGGRLFIPMGVAQPIAFTGEQVLGNVSNTTATSGDPTYVATATINLTPGTWRIAVEAEGTLWRSVNSGARVFGVSVDDGSPVLVHDLNLPALRTTPLPRGRALDVNVVVASARDVTVRYGFRGASSAGTTYCSGARILATATRIG